MVALTQINNVIEDSPIKNILLKKKIAIIETRREKQEELLGLLSILKIDYKITRDGISVNPDHLIVNLNIRSWQLNKRFVFHEEIDSVINYSVPISDYFYFLETSNDLNFLDALVQLYTINNSINDIFNEAMNCLPQEMLKRLIDLGAIVTINHFRLACLKNNHELTYYIRDHFFPAYDLTISDQGVIRVVTKLKDYPKELYKAANSIQKHWRQFYRASILSKKFLSASHPTTRNVIGFPRNTELLGIIHNIFPEKLDSNYFLFKETTHYTTPNNLIKILDQGSISSSNYLDEAFLARDSGISSSNDKNNKDDRLVCTAPFEVDSTLKDSPSITIDLEIFESNPSSSNIYFKFCDWAYKVKKLREQKAEAIPITDTIFLSINTANEHENGYIFKRNDNYLVTARIPQHQEVHHNLSSLQRYIVFFIFKIIAKIPDSHSDVVNEIYEYFLSLAKISKLKDHLLAIAKQLILYSELDFVNLLPLDLKYIKTIKFSNDEIIDVLVLKNTLEGGDFSCLTAILEKNTSLIKAKFFMTSIASVVSSNKELFNQNQITYLMEKLPFVFEQNTAESTQFARDSESPVNSKQDNLYKIISLLIKEKSNYEELAPIKLDYNETNNSIRIDLILDKDIRAKHTLQYDAERLLLLALGVREILDYCPNRVESEFFTYEYDFIKNTCNLSSTKSFKNIDEMMAATIKTICILAIAGESFNNSDLDPENCIRPSPGEVGKKAPATSYLNAHDSLLSKLNAGEIEVIVSDGETFIISTKPTALQLIATAFCLDPSLFKVETDQDFLISMKIATHYLVDQIKLTAINYFGISLIAEETGEILLLERHHPHCGESLGYDFTVGGSMPFPHNIHASVVSTLQWKLGLARAFIVNLLADYPLDLVSKNGDFASFVIRLSEEKLLAIKENNLINNQFYNGQTVKSIPVSDIQNEAICFNANTICQFSNLFNQIAFKIKNGLIASRILDGYGKFGVKISSINPTTLFATRNFGDIRIFFLSSVLIKSHMVVSLIHKLSNVFDIDTKQIEVKDYSIILRNINSLLFERKLMNTIKLDDQDSDCRNSEIFGIVARDIHL